MGIWVWAMVFGSGEAVGVAPMQPMVHGSWFNGSKLTNRRGQQLLWTRKTGSKQGSSTALGRVTRAKHSLVITRQGQRKMSVCESRSRSAGPWPGMGMAAMQQEV